MTIIHQENMNDATANTKSALHCVAASEIEGKFYALPVVLVCQQEPSQWSK